MDIIKGLFGKLWEDFAWFILALFGIAVIWFFNGGYNNESAHNGAYIKPLAPLDSGETYGNYYAGTPTSQKQTLNLPESPADVIRKTESVIQNFLSESKKAADIHATSVLSHSIYFDGIAGAKSKNPNAEYIRIIASGLATGPIKISGLSLQGAYFDGNITLPRAGGTTDIILNPGDRAIIATGLSPIGVSFKVNSCSSYLSLASTLVPALRKSAYAGTMTYEQCVAAHKSDKNFSSNEWRIFLGQETELWNNSSDIIKLVDSKGKIIDALTY